MNDHPSFQFFLRIIRIIKQIKRSETVREQPRFSGAGKECSMRIINRIAAALLASILALLPLCAAARAEAGVHSEARASFTTTFTFTNSGITASEEDEESYSIDGTALKIKAAGTYTLTGSCTNGSVTVKKGTTGVTLVLNNFDLKSADTAPILCNKGSEVNISAASGTVNRLTDTSYNNDDTHPENQNAENAVIKAKDGSRLTLSGSGTLNVIANGKNGVKGGMDLAADGDTPASSASITIKQLTLNVTANVNDAIKSEQLLSIQSGKITVAAADNAIRCDRTLNIGQSGSGPNITITSSAVGLSGAVVNVAGGNITVNSSSDGVKCASSALGDYPFACNITGGTLTVNSTDGDGVDSSGTLSFRGGSVTVFSSENNEDSPIESVNGITLAGGTLFGMGTAGMVENPSAAQQVYVTFGRMAGGSSELYIPKGSAVKLTDASGGALFSTTAPRNAGYIIFSSPSLTDGMKVKLLINGVETATATASYDAGNNPGVPGTPAPTAGPSPAPTVTPSPTESGKTPEPTDAAATATPTPEATDLPSSSAPETAEATGASETPEATENPSASTGSDAPLLTEAPDTDGTAGPGGSDAPDDNDAPGANASPGKRVKGGVLALIIGGAAVLAGAGAAIGISASRKKKNASRSGRSR